jgi:hypothetical protein
MGVLRTLFGPSKEEIWRQFCSETGAHYSEGGFGQRGKAQAVHGQWTVTLDTYVVSTGKTAVTYTRMRAPYVNPDGFRFKIYRKSIFTGFGKALGMQDVDIGEEEFDREFVVQGNSESRLRQLLANAKIRELLAAQPAIQFSVADDEGWFRAKFPEGVDELYFATVGVIKDVARLKLLYGLFSETLDELCRMGSAYMADPGVKL